MLQTFVYLCPKQLRICMSLQKYYILFVNRCVVIAIWIIVLAWTEILMELVTFLVEISLIFKDMMLVPVSYIYTHYNRSYWLQCACSKSVCVCVCACVCVYVCVCHNKLS